MSWLKNNYKLYGTYGLLRKLFRIVIRPVLANWDFLVYELNGTDRLSKDKGIRVYYKIEDIPKLLLKYNPSFAEECRRNLQTSIVTVYMVGNNLAGYGFVQIKGKYLLKGLGVDLSESDFVVIKNLVVYPAFRGLGIANKIHEARLGGLSCNTKVFGFVLKDNEPAIKNIRRMKCHLAGELRIKRTLFGRSYDQTGVNFNFEYYG